MRNQRLPQWLAILPISCCMSSVVLGQAPVEQTSPAVAEVASDVSDTSAISIVDAPFLISFQGLLEEDGTPANGLYDFVFRLKDFPTAGIQKWFEVQNDVQVTDGIYNVLLGSVQTLANVDFDDDLWLAIEVNGQPEILPRPQIVGVPYSFMSLEALDLRLPMSVSGVANVEGNPVFEITNTGSGDGLEVNGGGSRGIQVRNTGLDGIRVITPGWSAFYASGPGFDGLFVSNAGDDGVHVSSATDDGIFVDGVGGFAFHFRDIPSTNNGGLTTAYVGLIENPSTGSSADGLAIKIGRTGDPSAASNFIGFFDGDDDLIGQVEGNGSGGIAYTTTGSDYAEYLPHLLPNEHFWPGDVVGVYDGRITRRTEGAQQVMVITDQAAVLGNAPKGDEHVSGYESVSFIGQVPVRITGSVREGDYVVASGLDDGTAIAVSPKDITLDNVSQLVGRAWESSEAADTKRVNVVVGLDRSEALSSIIRRQSRELVQQQNGINELRTLLDRHMRQHVES